MRHRVDARVVRRLALLASIFLVTPIATAALVFGSADAASSNAGTPALAVYRDPILGFTLRLPAGWAAGSTAAVYGTDGSAGIEGTPRGTLADVRIDDGHPDHAFALFLVVLASPDAGALFRQQGTPTTVVGPYPAVASATPPSAQSPVPCASRAFLADDDDVLAQWCGADAVALQGVIVQVLASYRARGMDAAPPGPSAQAVRTRQTTPTARPSPTAPPAARCGELVARSGLDRTALPSGWGAELAAPDAVSSAPASTWTPTPGWGALAPGVAVCGNGDPAPYRGGATALFQCVELVNRFLGERWGLGPWYLAGDAGTYLDYFTGADDRHLAPVHRGSADNKPDIRIVPDARWGTNTAPPRPGDVLVWQDVADPATWRSVMTGPGHVAIVTAVDAQYVYVAQQNAMWSKGCGFGPAPCANAFMAYPLVRTPNGQGWSVDPGNLNGIRGRITRGWLHFAEDDGPAGPRATPPVRPTHEEVYAVGGDGHLYASSAPLAALGVTHPAADPAWSVVDLGVTTGFASPTPQARPPSAPIFAGTPSGQVDVEGGATVRHVDVISTTGDLYEFANATAGWRATDLSALVGGVAFVGSPAAVNYRDPATDLVHRVIFAINAGGDLYALDWTARGGWWARDLSLDAAGTSGGALLPPDVSFGSASAGAPHPVGPAATAVYDGTDGDEPVVYVDAVSADGHLYEFASGCDDAGCGGWTFEDLSSAVAATSSGTGVTLVGVPSTFALPSVAGGHDLHGAAVTGSDGHVYLYTYDHRAGWAVATVTTPATVRVAFRDGPSAVTVTSGAHSLLEIYATCADGSLYAFSADMGPSSQRWTSAKVLTGSVTLRAVGSPSVQIPMGTDGPALALRVITFVADDGLLSGMASRDGTTWSPLDFGSVRRRIQPGAGASEVAW